VNLELGEERELLRRTVREFAEERIGPIAAELDREHRFPYEIVAGLSELGVMGIPIPEEHGGAGLDTLSYALAVEELARVDSSVAITVAAHTSLGTMPIFLFGTDEQRSRWLPDLASGRRLAAFGLTEPGAGSDAGATRSRADERNGSWVVNGSKMFITNAGTDITACVTITAVTGDALLGQRGAGFHQFLEILDGGRISVAALAVGLSQGAYEQALAYAKERRQFGRPIGHFQAVQFRLADMATEIAAARQLVWAAAWLKDEGRPFGQEAAMAKLFSGLVSNRVVNAALELHGGYGYMEETPIARFFRDQKVLEIGEGTNEIQRLVIARHLGL
jgi:short-chain 2-methylacyl-CoA dehydrogenase